MSQSIPAAAPIRVRQDVLAVPAYRQGKAPSKNGFKLSSNENPFPPLPQVVAAIAGRLDFNRYNAADVTALRTQIAKTENTALLERATTLGTPAPAAPLTAAHVHVQGAGSVSILYQLIAATCGPGSNYVYPWPSFEAYPMLGLIPAATARAIPLREDATHDLTAIAAAVDENTGAVLLCTPNNPTSTIITKAEFAEFMAQVPSDVLVVLDEAYAEFVTESQAVRGTEVLQQYPNLVVLRTFAKGWGLAGLRLGYGFAAPELWQAVAPAGIPLSVNSLSETAALAALTPAASAQMRERAQIIVQRRQDLTAGLRQLGFAVPQPQGNFVWVPAASLTPHTAVALADYLAEQDILVRPFADYGVRISVGEAQSVPAVLNACAAFLGKESK